VRRSDDLGPTPREPAQLSINLARIGEVVCVIATTLFFLLEFSLPRSSVGVKYGAWRCPFLRPSSPLLRDEPANLLYACVMARTHQVFQPVLVFSSAVSSLMLQARISLRPLTLALPYRRRVPRRVICGNAGLQLATF